MATLLFAKSQEPAIRARGGGEISMHILERLNIGPELENVLHNAALFSNSRGCRASCLKSECGAIKVLSNRKRRQSIQVSLTDRLPLSGVRREHLAHVFVLFGV